MNGLGRAGRYMLQTAARMIGANTPAVKAEVQKTDGGSRGRNAAGMGPTSQSTVGVKRGPEPSLAERGIKISTAAGSESRPGDKPMGLGHQQGGTTGLKPGAAARLMAMQPLRAPQDAQYATEHDPDKSTDYFLALLHQGEPQGTTKSQGVADLLTAQGVGPMNSSADDLRGAIQALKAEMGSNPAVAASPRQAALEPKIGVDGKPARHNPATITDFMDVRHNCENIQNGETKRVEVGPSHDRAVYQVSRREDVLILIGGSSPPVYGTMSMADFGKLGRYY